MAKQLVTLLGEGHFKLCQSSQGLVVLSFEPECQERLESTGDAGRTPPLSAFDSQSRADCFRIACVSSARNEEGRTRSYSTHTQAQGRQAPLRPAGADKGLRGGERKSFHWITSLAGGKGGISPHIYLISEKKEKCVARN